MKEIRKAANRWWRSKRPLGWNKECHLNNPAVNCETNKEKDLAYAVANGIIKRREEKNGTNS